MKKLIVTIVLVISSLSFAQEKSKLSPEQQTELQVKKMTLDLDLDANQQNELKTILLEQNKKRATKIAELKDKKKQGVKLSADEKFKMKSIYYLFNDSRFSSSRRAYYKNCFAIILIMYCFINHLVLPLSKCFILEKNISLSFLEWKKYMIE